MYEYSICDVFDEEIFIRQCRTLEKTIAPLVKEELLVDVDGSQIQRYRYQEKSIIVYNSTIENEVYVKSEIELESFFNS